MDVVLAALVILPLAAGCASFLIRGDAARRTVLAATAAIHLGLSVLCAACPPPALLGGTISLDALGTLFLLVTSSVFAAAAFYAIAYLGQERKGARPDFEENVRFANAPEAVFTGCLLLLLATMTLVTMSRHLGVLWVSVEATTLSSAPLLYFHRHHRSLEAAWKYLLLCSVGLALALLANFFIVAAARAGGSSTTMLLDDLLRAAPAFDTAWIHAAFLLFLVGYGTKMGLAPLHMWLPDAHGEAPSLVSALLSGAVLNCAFLGIVRAFQVLAAAGQARFAEGLLVVFGLFSLGLAAAFLLTVQDFKRLLAYSSVEHVGLLALGVGLGGAAATGSMLHAVNHSLSKSALFLVAGNLLAIYGTKKSDQVRGAMRVLPLSGLIWIAGLFAITGTPPFGAFLSELLIVRQAFDSGRAVVGSLALAFLALAFFGFARTALPMARGPAPEELRVRRVPEPVLLVAPPAVLLASTLLLGVYIPHALHDLVTAAAAVVGGSP